MLTLNNQLVGREFVKHGLGRDRWRLVMPVEGQVKDTNLDTYTPLRIAMRPSSISSS